MRNIWSIGGVRGSGRDHRSPAPAQAATPRPSRSVADVDELPTAMTLSAAATLAEGTYETGCWPQSASPMTSSAANLAEVAENDLMEICNGTELWLKDGAELDFEAQKTPSYTVTVSGTGDHEATFTVEDHQQHGVRLRRRPNRENSGAGQVIYTAVTLDVAGDQHRTGRKRRLESLCHRRWRVTLLADPF